MNTAAESCSSDPDAAIIGISTTLAVTATRLGLTATQSLQVRKAQKESKRPLVAKQIDELVREDGINIAKLYLVPVLPKLRAIREKRGASAVAVQAVRMALQPIVSLRELAASHPAFDFIVAEVCLNRLQLPSNVGAKVSKQ